jgi:hypothetical protein
MKKQDKIIEENKKLKKRINQLEYYDTNKIKKALQSQKQKMIEDIEKWWNAETTCSGSPHCCIDNCDLCVNCYDELLKTIGEKLK